MTAVSTSLTITEAFGFLGRPPHCLECEAVDVVVDHFALICNSCNRTTKVNDVVRARRQIRKPLPFPTPRPVEDAPPPSPEPRRPRQPRRREVRREQVTEDADARVRIAARDLAEPIKLGVDVHRVVDECAVALLRCPELYCRSGELVRVGRDGIAPAGVTRPANAPAIRTVPPATLLETLTRVQTFSKFDKRQNDWAPATPSSAVLAALSARGSWPGMRQLHGLLEAPAMRPDGSVIQAEGFDATTGFLYLPSQPFPLVPDRPTREDAIAARDELLEVVADFPFATAAHRSAWLSFVLTLFARPAIAGCTPLVAVDATAPGTGKGRLVDVTAILATGREATKTPLPQDDEECRKRITSLLIEGERLAVLDNVAETIAFPALDAALTATLWKDRLLGKNASVTVPNLMMWAVTGNNLSIGGDLARRTLHIRLESRVEDPENRTGFKHHPLLPWVEAERPRLVAATLTILRAHAVAGRPSCNVKAWGSFESWSSVVASAVAWVDMPDPQLTREGLTASADVARSAARVLLDGWERLTARAPEGLTVKSALAILYTAEQLRGHSPPDGYDDLREAIEALVPTLPGKAPSPIKLAGRIRSLRRRVMGGRMFDGVEDRKGVVRWVVRSAGVAGLAEDAPNPSRENGSDKITNTGGNNTVKPGNPCSSPESYEAPGNEPRDDDEPGFFDDPLLGGGI